VGKTFFSQVKYTKNKINLYKQSVPALQKTQYSFIRKSFGEFCKKNKRFSVKRHFIINCYVLSNLKICGIGHITNSKKARQIFSYLSTLTINDLGRDSVVSVDLLWAERSGDRISVVARIAAPAQNGLGAGPASNKMGTNYLSEDKGVAAWR
jgi:hypothetical protein